MVIVLELNLIKEDKLKVILTPFDMIKYDLTCDKIDYDNTETRKAVWSILDYAKHETGFDAAACRIYIQVYPEKNGGCEIYITKLQKKELPSVLDMNEPEEKAAAAVQKENTAVYQFEDAENLMRVCKFLERRGYALKSVAFVEETLQKKHRYYLLICEPSPFMTGKKAKYLRENLFIGEFGTRIEHKSASAYLKEHCRCLCEKDAVHTLAALAR